MTDRLTNKVTELLCDLTADWAAGLLIHGLSDSLMDEVIDWLT